MTISRLIGTTTATMLAFGVAITGIRADRTSTHYKTMPRGTGSHENLPGRSGPKQAYPAAQAPAAPGKAYPGCSGQDLPGCSSPGRLEHRPTTTAQTPAAPGKTHHCHQTPAMLPGKTYPAAQTPAGSSKTTTRLPLWPSSGNAFKGYPSTTAAPADSGEDWLPSARNPEHSCPYGAPARRSCGAPPTGRRLPPAPPVQDPRCQEDLISGFQINLSPTCTPVMRRPGFFVRPHTNRPAPERRSTSRAAGKWCHPRCHGIAHQTSVESGSALSQRPLV